MKEQDLIDLGFKRTDVTAEESGDEAFYYYTYDIGNGVISLITQSNDEVKDNDWHVEVFDDTSIRFETIEDITSLYK